MVQSLGQNWQDVNDAALPVIGKAARTTNEVAVTALDREVNVPCRLYGAIVPDSKLYFGTSQPSAGDGSGKTLPPIDDALVASPDGSLDYQVDSSMVAGITLTREGAAYTHPTATAGECIVGAFVRKANGSFDCKYSSVVANLAAAQAIDLGPIFSALDGVNVGWVLLENTDGAGRWKTIGSSTPVIQAEVSGTPRIFRIGSGGGTGGGTDRTYKFTSFSATGGTMKGGYRPLDDNRILASGSGTTSTTTGVDQTVNLNTVLTNSGLAAIGTINSGSAKLLALAIDLTTLNAQVQLTDNLRQVYNWGEANLKFIDQTDLLMIDPTRYVVINQVYLPITVASWATATAIHRQGGTHDTLTAFFPYIERYESPQQTSASASIPLTHGLSGEPQIVQIFYFDGTKKIDVTKDSLIGKTSTQVLIATLGLTFGGTQYVEVKAFWFPTTPNVASASRTFSSPWYTDNSVTTVAHGLSDMDDIRGYAVQEWNTVTGKRRQMDQSSLVENFDGTNFTLNWFGLSPSATLQYRVVAGGSPLPWSIPTSEEYDVIFTAEPSWPIAHGLTDVPTSIRALQEVATDQWQPVNLQGLVSATSTQLLGSLASLSPGASPARVRLIATISR